MKIQVPTQFREMKLRSGVPPDRDSRTVSFSFSSEEPYQRNFGMEILSHDTGAMITDRFDRGAVPFLLNHDYDDQVGTIVQHSISNRKGIATAKLSRSDRGEEVFQDIVDKIRTNISVGYIVHEMSSLGTDDGGNEHFLVESWEPLEISLVSIPADPTVGIARDAELEMEMAIAARRYAGNDLLFAYAEAHGGMAHLCDIWKQNRMGTYTEFLAALVAESVRDAQLRQYVY